MIRAAALTRVRAAVPIRSLVAGSALSVAAGALQVSVFLSTVLVARRMGEAALGRYAVALAAGSILVGGLTSGLPVLLLRETSARGLDRHLVQAATRLQLRLASAGIVLSTATTGLLLGKQGLVLGALAGSAYGALGLLSTGAAVHTAIGQHRVATSARLLCAPLIVALTWLALKAGFGLPGALAAMSIAATLGAMVTLRFLLYSNTDGSTSGRTHVLLSNALVLCGLGFINGGYQRIDAFVVLALAGAGTAGTYAAAYRLLSPFALAASGFGTLLLCRLSGVSAMGDAWHVVRRRAARLLAISLIPVAATFFLLMPTVVRVVYGPEFAGAVGPARVLMVSILPFVAYVPNLYALNAARQERRLLAVLGASIIIEIALIGLLVKLDGASGAAWGWVLTECFVFGGIFVVLRSPTNTTHSATPTTTPGQ